MALPGLGTPDHYLYDGVVLKDLGGGGHTHSYYVSVKSLQYGGQWSFCVDVPDGTDMSTSEAICQAVAENNKQQQDVQWFAKGISSNTTTTSSETLDHFSTGLSESKGEI